MITDMHRKFHEGEVITRREILDGLEWITYPVRVACDEDDLLAVYLAQDTPLTFGKGEFRWGPHPWAEIGATWQSEGVLQLQRPGDGYSVWMFRKKGLFAGWYINFQEPFRRSASGFDTLDQELDIWMPGNSGEFQWKDVDEFEQRVTSGGFNAEEAAAVRAESNRVVAMIESDTIWWKGWESWTPPTHWATPEDLGVHLRQS
ncbi:MULTISPECIES: DUF402 domain-containing protein [unclassified Streptomyces]|uniref:DUF402 domain-containing protein n=1 Tax=unclassified Streptomyces TaxID=2593676 RepID=UPI001F5219E7|nr:DUF402 domain-containing protein [Streptomyces sp. CB01883]